MKIAQKMCTLELKFVRFALKKNNFEMGCLATTLQYIGFPKTNCNTYIYWDG